MRLQTVITLAAILTCDAKLPTHKSHIQPNELPPNPTQNAQALRLLDVQAKSAKTSRIVNEYKPRHRRDVFDSKSYNESSLIWAHSERLDENGDVVLRWVNSDSSITFRVEARTRGYVGIGFNSARNMRGADLLVAWVDDRNNHAHVLDCHGLTFEDRAVADEVQNVELVSGYQNDTHTTVEFRRMLDTCDIQDFVIGDDTMQVLWALGPDGSDGELPKHVKSGSRPLRLLLPVSKPQTIPLRHWDVRINNLTIPHDMATLFWCKIFKAPDLPMKHHIVGYQPLIDSRPIRDGVPMLEKNSLSPVHHMVLYECAEDPDQHLWKEWANQDGFYGPSRPSEWATCVTPVAAWAIGSKGEFLPENVGIPLGEKTGVSFYMLEVHYDNQALHEVLDNSGIRIHYTPALRAHDAALLGAGVGVSALHVIPPKQKQYRTVGICSPECTNSTMPEEGINIVSVLLHAHGTARKISLKHVRGNNELPRISEENSYDVRYQQSRIVPGGRRFLKGDTLITECTYDSSSRDKPILGGYSASQEMCLSFVLYYPRTELAGCYSMTPVKEFFETFGVREFYALSMTDVENIFLSSGNLENLPPKIEFDIRQHASESEAMQGDDQGVGLMKELIIREPAEFQNKTFLAHLNQMPWSESVLTEQIEKTLYKGMHMTFCKKRDDNWGAPIQIQNYPDYVELVSNEAAEKSCNYKSVLPQNSVTKSANSISSSLISAILAVCTIIVTR
ncbi:MOXD1 homolog 1-like [Cydia pomonella]|uniref:MOXD1 homolog 1-like n=1 Tax=Cydia pomonella TaxID=82600 RepID=UPI002ADDEC3A|nr:MOXD1 homolog 1-like [Cydia pomonella]XP_061718924.1 MOXD1 homolog 1-like [Cydia pomonella]XP_061718926.1 MOXD1 homolog 1-like [Cydia pomonella]